MSEVMVKIGFPTQSSYEDLEEQLCNMFPGCHFEIGIAHDWDEPVEKCLVCGEASGKDRSVFCAPASRIWFIEQGLPEDAILRPWNTVLGGSDDISQELFEELRSG